MISMNDKRLLILFLASLIMVSCGGGGSSDTKDDGGGEVITNTAPVAAGGDDFLVSRNFNVSLDGEKSSDAENDSLSYTWAQTAGTDVTNGTGSFSGATPSFQAPDNVGTLIFELVVNDGEEDSSSDTVVVNVLENVNTAYFVDADKGDDDTGNGNQARPFASIAMALCEVSQEQQDIYVMSRASAGVYDETTDPCPGKPVRSSAEILTVPTGTSLYGGYDENWIRNEVNNPTSVESLQHGFIFTNVDLNAWFSGFKLKAADSPVPDDSAYALSVLGGSAGMYIVDNDITAGNVAFGDVASPGTSYGLRVALIESVTIERNIISAGFGGDGLNVTGTYNVAAAAGGNGVHASGRTAGEGGVGKAPDYKVGGNGSAGGGILGNCNSGASGASGKNIGVNGVNGSGGSGSGNIAVYIKAGFYVSFLTGKGENGKIGRSGDGGKGGSGGSGCYAEVGGGGGGGAGGGGGGLGGPAGIGGGASIGVFIARVNTSLINNNEISSAVGGDGASGDLGQSGGAGGVKGSGANGSCTLGVCAGKGGSGGEGRKGGNGGHGGAGGGGPSYGIAVGSNISPTISNNTIVSGSAGLGGAGGDGGNGGAGGHSYAIFDFNINDGLVPILNNNELAFGVAGDGGGTSGLGGIEGNSGSTGVRNWP